MSASEQKPGSLTELQKLAANDTSHLRLVGDEDTAPTKAPRKKRATAKSFTEEHGVSPFSAEGYAITLRQYWAEQKPVTQHAPPPMRDTRFDHFMKPHSKEFW